ncbi:MAG: hypothetical protein IJN59_06200 [Oscillospiraceae bacterium]|nr:hypothetical protein [Oscillospiraceae bacterium]
MKKLFSVMLAFLMVTGCMSITAFADDSSATVYVSIADKGRLVAAQTKVTVTDIDGDNALTVNDALYAAHKAVYPGGAKDGYGYYTHKDYGLSISRLWGDTSGNFGYYINNSSCWSLADSVKSGDYLNAFVYSDSKKYSDKYCFFNDFTVTADSNSDIELTLSSSGYDASWNPVTLPVANAEITVDGKATGVKTDANGKATIQISGAGEHIISAVSASETLVPPVCTAQINGGIFASVLSAITSFLSAIINFILSIFA